MNLNEVLKGFDDSNIHRVQVGIFDIDGVLRGKHITRKKFESSVVSGLGFCDVLFGWDIHDTLYGDDPAKPGGWRTGFPDATARIDLDSFRLVPWEPGTALFLVDLQMKDGEPHPGSPRQLFRNVAAKAESLGYATHLSTEYEFSLFRETPASVREKSYRGLTPMSPSVSGFNLVRVAADSPWVLDMMDLPASFQVPLESFNAASGPGAYEAALAVDKGLAAADKAALFKTAVREIAARHQLLASFMAQWNPDVPGAGGHIHQSLWDRDRDKNLFHAGGGRMSDLMQFYIAGLVKNLPDFLVMFCPTVNSYKRLKPGSWAPVNATWGVDNRSAAVRAIPGGSHSTRVEMRAGGADANPYLAMAACLSAGLDGIDNQIDLPPPTQNGYTGPCQNCLPRSLEEATARFRSSETARRWFGDAFVEHYAATREWESRQFHQAITDWELNRYFESI